MTWRGLVESVNTVKPRGFLVADQTAGDTVLGVYGGDAFLSGDAESDTGQVVIDGGTYAFTSVVESDDESVTPSSLTITPGLLADVENGEPVELVTTAESKFADVVSDDGIGDAITARVPHELVGYAALADGTYTGDDRPTVDVESVNGEQVVKNVVGEVAAFDGGIITGTIPPAAMTDGLAPSLSPLCATVGAIGTIFVMWLGITNADPVTYEVHVSDTPGFTASDLTLLATTPATMVTAKTLADGTPFAYDVDYYFRVVATDADGAANEGAEASGQMNQTQNADLVGDAIDGMTITGATVRTASAGQRVQLDTAGLHTYDSSNAETAKIDASSGGMALSGNLDLGGTGVIRTATSGKRVEIDDDGATLYTTDPVQVKSFPTVGGCFTLALDPSGNVSVADSVTGLIRKFDPTGAPLLTFAYSIVGGISFGIFIDGSGNTYVTLSSGTLLHKFNSSGVEIVAGGFPMSTIGIARGVFVDGSGFIYLADQTNSKLRKFTSAGVQVLTGGFPISTTGPPTSVTLDAAGFFYAVDSTNEKLRKFTSAGIEITTGNFPISLAGTNPSGVTTDSALNTYVTGYGVKSVFKFDSTGAPLPGIPSVDKVAVADVKINVNGDVVVVDATSSLVRIFNNPGTAISSALLHSSDGRLAAFDATISGNLQADTISSPNGLTLTSQVAAPLKTQAGIVAATIPIGSAALSVHVDFPTTFLTQPIVVSTVRNGSTHGYTAAIDTSPAPTLTGFNINFIRYEGMPTTAAQALSANWIAMVP